MTSHPSFKKAVTDVIDNSSVHADMLLLGVRYSEIRYLRHLCVQATVSLGWATEKVSLWLDDIVVRFREDLWRDHRPGDRTAIKALRRADHEQ